MVDLVAILTAVVAVLTAVGWMMALYKLRDLARNPGNVPLRALCVALVAISGALTVQRAAPVVDQFVGRLDFGRVTANCLTLVAAGFGQVFLLYTTGQDAATRGRVRRRLGTLAVALAAIVILYVLTRPRYPVDDPFVRSGAYYDRNTAPLMAPFVFVHLVYIGWATVQIATLSRRYANIATRPLLRFGLRLITAGAWTGTGYVAIKFANMALQRLTARVPGLADAIIVASFATTVLLILLGATLPSWGRLVGLDRVAERAATLHAYHQLTPLWRELCRVDPTIALLPAPRGLSAPVRLFREAELRLVRRVVEIRDGYRMLRPFADPAAEDDARERARRAGITGDDLDATVEAAALAAAIRNRQQEQPAPHPPPPIGSSTSPPPDPTTEVARLVSVTKAYQHSPIVNRRRPSHT